jgi:hypothetical protein
MRAAQVDGTAALGLSDGRAIARDVAVLALSNDTAIRM